MPAIPTPPGPLSYLSGFGNQFSSEALAGALPAGRNSPQHPPYGLYAEQFSGTAFTVPRSEARRTWLYRLQPAANHPRFERLQRQLPGRDPGVITPPTGCAGTHWKCPPRLAISSTHCCPWPHPTPPIRPRV